MLYYCLWNVLVPKPEGFGLQQKQNGRYEEVNEVGGYEVTISDNGRGYLSVDFEPQVRWSHYLLSAALAALGGFLFYQGLQQQEAKRSEDEFRERVEPAAPDEDPLYEEFLAGDEKRRFLPRSVLEKDFQAWREIRRAGKPERDLPT